MVKDDAGNVGWLLMEMEQKCQVTVKQKTSIAEKVSFDKNLSRHVFEDIISYE
jgi:hypothetical protein